MCLYIAYGLGSLLFAAFVFSGFRDNPSAVVFLAIGLLLTFNPVWIERLVDPDLISRKVPRKGGLGQKEALGPVGCLSMIFIAVGILMTLIAIGMAIVTAGEA